MYASIAIIRYISTWKLVCGILHRILGQDKTWLRYVSFTISDSQSIYFPCRYQTETRQSAGSWVNLEGSWSETIPYFIVIWRNTTENETIYSKLCLFMI